jgi:hypothetical protein
LSQIFTFLKVSIKMIFMMYARTFLNATTGLGWRDGENSSVLRDDDRYFGHTVKSTLWRAYGVTTPSRAKDQLTCLGTFKTREGAKAAVIGAVAPLLSEPAAIKDQPRFLTAGR